MKFTESEAERKSKLWGPAKSSCTCDREHFRPITSAQAPSISTSTLRLYMPVLSVAVIWDRQPLSRVLRKPFHIWFCRI
jgi:hypothetical protein